MGGIGEGGGGVIGGTDFVMSGGKGGCGAVIGVRADKGALASKSFIT